MVFGNWRGSCAVVVAVAGLLAAIGCNTGQQSRTDMVKEDEPAAAQARAEQDALARGKYLVSVLGCHDCHTPSKMGPNGPEPDVSRTLSGHPEDVKMPPPPVLTPPWAWAGSVTNTAFSGPWGLSYAINLTSDEETGIGLWSEQVFVNAIKTGRHMGVGRPILPPMPWSVYANLTEEDLKAIFAFLRTVEPRRNQVPEAVVKEAPAPAAEGKATEPRQ
jgi:mono/diheme cytochrome c family protein